MALSPDCLQLFHTPAVWLSLDSTSIARPEAETSPDRGMIYVCNLLSDNEK